jgi:hypothetical protein
MTTLTNILANQNTDTRTVSVGTFELAPAGTFCVTIKTADFVVTYLLAGTPNDKNAPILGRAEHDGTPPSAPVNVYLGGGTTDGRLVRFVNFETAFAQMVTANA